MDESIIIRLIFLGALLALSAFFSGCEAAFFSLSRLKVDNLESQKGRRGKMVAALLANPRLLLTVIYAGNEMVNVAAAAVVTSVSIHFLGDSGVGFAIGIGTLLILVFGEITPKTLVLRHAESFALGAAPFLNIFSLLIKPVNQLLARIADLSVHIFLPIHRKKGELTEGEIKTIVTVGEGEGVIEADEKDLIHNIFEFGDTTVSEIMTPKNDVFSLDANTSVPDIISRAKKTFFSRIPVYEDNKENIIGVLYMKDILRLHISGKKDLSLRQMLHPAFIIPESKKVRDLLRDFKIKKVHLAVVYDEYGGLEGIATLEDVLEEIVGEIEGERRRDDVPVIKMNENEYAVLGNVPIQDFNEEFGSSLPDEEYNSIGGFVFSLLGRLPIKGESVSHENMRFIVDKVKGPRILRLLLKVNIKPEEKAA
ncbi:MAG: HlyC/CorC family transporter [Nitrospinae bacterium]|nr:HlyC/CorC family transporter [Nitrospinota bacterium]